MFSTRVAFSYLCVALSLVTLSNAWALDINTPTLVQCKAAYLSWAGDYPPFAVSIVSQKNGSTITNFFQKNSQNLTWIVNIPSGNTVALKVTDSKGNNNWSNGVTIQSSSNSACLNAAVMEPSASSGMTVAGNGTARATGAVHAPLNGTLPGVSSGSMGTGGSATSGIGAKAAATTTSTTEKSSAMRNKSAAAGLGLFGACLALALVA